MSEQGILKGSDRGAAAARRFAWILVAALLLSAPSASRAAVTIGHTGGGGSNFCDSNNVLVQRGTTAGNPSYEAPTGGGVITSWSMQAYAQAASLKLKVFRGSNNPFLVVGQSTLRQLKPNSLNTFAVSPGIPVQAGDKIGLQTPPIVISGKEALCYQDSASGDVISFDDGDPAPGTTYDFPGFVNSKRLNVAAAVEPDADGDGLGDESQDPCPTTPGSSCPFPRGVAGADNEAPRVENLSARPRAFQVVSRRRRGRAGAAKGTWFSYRLSEAATVTFTIERRSRGRLVKRRCVKRRRANRKSKPCRRFTRVGSFTQKAAAGANRKRFTGRIGRRVLKPGSYRATLQAVDASRNASTPRGVGFKVVRATRRRGR